MKIKMFVTLCQLIKLHQLIGSDENHFEASGPGTRSGYMIMLVKVEAIPNGDDPVPLGYEVKIYVEHEVWSKGQVLRDQLVAIFGMED